MEMNETKIFYAVSGFLAVLSYVFIKNDYVAFACASIYAAIYWFGCGIDDYVDTAISNKEIPE